MTHAKKTLVVAAAAVLLAGAIVCHGRVFARWSTTSHSTEAIERTGGRVSYDAAMTLNGGNGQLTVFGFDKPIAATVRELARLFHIENFTYDGGTMAAATVTQDDRILKLIAVTLDNENKTTLFKFEQSVSEAKASGEHPARHFMDIVPPYPGSEPVFYARDNNTGMGMELSSAQGEPATIKSFYNSSLAGSGWKSVVPGGSASSDLAVFVKGAEVCCVFVSSAGADTPGRSRITVLHKPLEMK